MSGGEEDDTEISELQNNMVCGVVGLEIDWLGSDLNIHTCSAHTILYLLVLLKAPYKAL